MKVLLGEFNKGKVEQHLIDNKFGRMWASKHPHWSYEGEPWGFDNGAWSAYVNETEFDGQRFKIRMAEAERRAPYGPLVACVPDIVGDGLGTLATSRAWLESGLPKWNWYIVLQDGVCPERLRRLAMTYKVAGLFLGGTDDFKRTAGHWCRVAHQMGLKFHFGRCNREAWIRNALEIGADSIDTATPLRRAADGDWDKFHAFVRLVKGQDQQQSLPFVQVGDRVRVLFDSDGASGQTGQVDKVFNTGRVQVSFPTGGFRNLPVSAVEVVC